MPRAPFPCPLCTGGGLIHGGKPHTCIGSKAWPAAGTPDGLREQIGFAASRTFAQFWLAEVSKIEETVLDPAARWDVLRSALGAVGNGRTTEQTKRGG